MKRFDVFVMVAALASLVLGAIGSVRYIAWPQFVSELALLTVIAYFLFRILGEVERRG